MTDSVLPPDTSTIVISYTVKKSHMFEAMQFCNRLERKKVKSKLHTVAFYFGVFGAALICFRFIERSYQPLIILFCVGLYAGIALMEWRSRRFTRRHSELALATQQKSGPTKASFGQKGLSFENKLGKSVFSWDAVDEIGKTKSATIFRIGAMNYPIPDAVLPSDLSTAEFGRRIDEWRAGA